MLAHRDAHDALAESVMCGCCEKRGRCKRVRYSVEHCASHGAVFVWGCLLIFFTAPVCKTACRLIVELLVKLEVSYLRKLKKP